jgi:hypothetical protein
VNYQHHLWGKIWLYFYVTIRKISATVFTDIGVTGAWEMSDVTDGISEVTGDIPDMMTVRGKYLDGIGIVGVGWFRV